MLHDRICSIIFNIMIFCVKYYITYLYIVWQCLLNCYISDHVMYLLVYVLLYSLLYSLLCCLINKIQHTMVYDMSYNANFTVCVINVQRRSRQGDGPPDCPLSYPGPRRGPGQEPCQGPALGKPEQRRSRDHSINVSATPTLPNANLRFQEALDWRNLPVNLNHARANGTNRGKGASRLPLHPARGAILIEL